MSEILDELFSDDVAPAPTAPPVKFEYQGEDSALDAIEGANEGADLSKPWMRFHRFALVTAADEVRALVDRAIQVGRVALDLETEGLDNRIEFRADGSCYTRHQIVGYCLGIERDGYYIPVRHVPELKTDPNPNVDSVERTEAEIKRLCEAAQPVLKNGSIDVLGAKEKDFEVPPRVVIEFWHAKFDQEFLYPVTGIDIWNPSSFEDGMLMVYTLCTEADQGLKDNARERLKPQVDPETGKEFKYEMIEYKDLFPRDTPKSERKFQFRVPRDVMPGWNYVLYGCSDAICTGLLCSDLRQEVAADKRQYGFYTLEKQVAQVVRVIERTRVLINKGEIASLLAEAEKEQEECEQLIRARAVAVGFPSDFNPASSAQLADFLFGPKGISKGKKPEKTAEGQYKTDEKTIEQYAKEPDAPDAFALIIKHRQISKVRGTYLQNLVDNTDELNQLRLNFKQTGAATGRFTAPKGDPAHGYAGVPIQGIPARDDPKKPKVAHSMRRLFIARPGYVIVKADYASQELRIATSTSGEQKWIAEYEKEAHTGEPADLHHLTAAAFYPGLTKDWPDYKIKRNGGKTANFALIYGGGVGAVQRATGCDKVEGARLKKAFDDSVPGFSKWVRGQHKRVKEDRGVYTAFKRFIAIPDANIDRDTIVRKWRGQGKKFSESEVGQEIKKIRAACERKATNFPIQGAGADILKISLVLLLREFHLRRWLRTGGDDSVRMIMTVHDEVVFEIREDRVADALPILVKIMESPSRLIPSWRVPLVVEADIGPSWAAKVSWSGLFKGEKRPPYLEGKTLTREPEVLVLGKKAGPASSPPPAAAAPASVRPPSTSSLPPAPIERAAAPRPSLPPPSPDGGTKRVASFRLRSAFVDYPTVCMIAQACAAARLEAAKLKKLHEQIPVEFLIGGERSVLLYSAKEDYRVYAPELEGNLRRMNLLDDYVIREEHA